MRKLIETNTDIKINAFMPNGYKAETRLMEKNMQSYIKITITSADGDYIFNEIAIDTGMGIILQNVLRMTLDLVKKRVKPHKEYVGELYSEEGTDELKEFAKEVGYDDIGKIV